MIRHDLQLFGGRGSSSKGGSKGGPAIGTSYGSIVIVDSGKSSTRKSGK